MSAKSSFRDAVLEDGCYVLCQVVTKLYRGENFRPDIYFKRDKLLCRKNYNGIFNGEQRLRIQESGVPEDYDIGSGVRHFDVSLLALLVEHTCGLTAGEPLLQKTTNLRDLRNKVSHPSEAATLDINQENIKAKLHELLNLYLDIIEDLETKVGYKLPSYSQQVHKNVILRLQQAQPSGAVAGQNSSASLQNATVSNEMPTWGKVALGVTAGVAALGIAGALALGLSGKGGKKKNSNRTTEK